jgi:LmbE family N-acetylglucosaminyl deacetylase
MKLLPLALSFLLTGSLFAQTPQFTDPANLRGERVKPRDGRELPIDTGVLGLQQLLRRLNTRASILNIVAHPDDEDGGMLTLYSRGLGARVADLSLTRGEGGQNAMTGDFEDALGLLRTQELLANDRYTGVDQMFGTEVDFGFSKTKSEAFAKWTHDRVLYDAVRAIRLYRPMVITSTWTGNVTDGHGQHQVSGQIAQEAFVAAADPKVFPDMIAEGILPWQALRVYARVPQGAITDKGLYDYATNQFVPATFTNYVTGEVSTTVPSTDVTVHEGTTDPLLTPASANPTDLSPTIRSQPPTTRLSYVQFARIGLGLQKSQIGPNFRIPTPGAFDVAYHLYGSAPGVAAGFSPLNQSEPNFFEGIDTSIESLASLAPDASPELTTKLHALSQTLANAQREFNPHHPEATAPALDQASTILFSIVNLLNHSPNVSWAAWLPQRTNLLHEIWTKAELLNQALALAYDINFDATTIEEDLQIGKPVTVRTSVTASPLAGCTVDKMSAFAVSGNSYDAAKIDPLSGKPVSNEPLRNSIVIDRLQATAITRPYFSRVDIEQPVYDLVDRQLRNAPQTPFAISAMVTVVCQKRRIILGRVVHSSVQPVSFVPPVNLSLSARAQVLIRYREPGFVVYANLKTDIPKNAVPRPAVHLEAPKGWVVKDTTAAADGRSEFLVVPPEAHDRPSGTVTGLVTFNGATYNEGYRPVGYGDLPRTNYFIPATDRIVPIDLKLLNPAHENIAYIPGTGDAIPEALASINLAPTILTVADLTPTTLAKYDTVILGVRTYSAHPDLHGAPTAALLDYARNGGNVVVQYQTPEFTAADAPYPLSLGSNEKVVDESAPVTLLDSTSSLLTTPNHITSADFDNWIEERGHGFLSTWDDRYKALSETHDPGAPSEHVAPQLPQRGGLVTTTLGKGRWTYVAFALYRQLPEAVPGAYRLFLNLLNP